MKAALYNDIEHALSSENAVNAISLISMSNHYNGWHIADCTELTQIQLHDNKGFHF